MHIYNADLAETPKRDGTFSATLRDRPISVVSRDPEHDLAAEMVAHGLAEGAIQFWRGETPSLHFKSVYRAAEYHIKLGEEYPRRAKRKPAPENLRDLVSPVHGDGQTSVECPTAA